MDGVKTASVASGSVIALENGGRAHPSMKAGRLLGKACRLLGKSVGAEGESCIGRSWS